MRWSVSDSDQNNWLWKKLRNSLNGAEVQWHTIWWSLQEASLHSLRRLVIEIDVTLFRSREKWMVRSPAWKKQWYLIVANDLRSAPHHCVLRCDFVSRGESVRSLCGTPLAILLSLSAGIHFFRFSRHQLIPYSVLIGNPNDSCHLGLLRYRFFKPENDEEEPIIHLKNPNLRLHAWSV